MDWDTETWAYFILVICFQITLSVILLVNYGQYLLYQRLSERLRVVHHDVHRQMARCTDYFCAVMRRLEEGGGGGGAPPIIPTVQPSEINQREA
ncbi:putative movement protein [Utkilio virus]|nr:putative movement protein [Utkilio virus]